VEDDEMWREKLQGFFKSQDHQVVGVADNEDEAIRLFRAFQPDLVTMDGSLRDNQPSLPVAATIRKENEKVVIVMITGYPDLFFEGRGLCKLHFENNVLKGFLRSL